MRVQLSKTFSFEAAHYLPGFPDGHKCRRLHGHSYKVDVVVGGEIREDKGYLIDYGRIAEAFAPIYEQLDHHCLNEIEGLENPTAEMLAKWIWDRLEPRLQILVEIDVHETCTSGCRYRGPDPE